MAKLDERSELRAFARTLFDCAVDAADPAKALSRAFRSAPPPRPDAGGQTILIAVGKAAPTMLSEALRHVEGQKTAICVTHRENEQDVPDARVFRAGHPVPDEVGHEAALAVIETLQMAGAKDRVIALISGGGSALLPAPAGDLTLSDKAEVNKLLLGSGLDIVEMNLVRQQLSRIKGGGMLRLAHPAPVTGYILSDVIGDDLRAIASGPTVSPIGSAKDAVALMRDAGIWESAPDVVRTHLTNAGAPPQTPRAENHLIGSNRISLDAMVEKAREVMPARIVSDHLTGDVEAAAQFITDTARESAAGGALIFGGETTVRLRGDGVGGRNQELALRVAANARSAPLKEGWVFLSGGTDGRDGPTDAAGGLVDGGTVARIEQARLDLDQYLARNDSYHALEAAGDLLFTGATGTNVADVQVMLIPD